MRFQQLSLVLVCCAAGCIPAFRQPTVGEPHATLRVRRVFIDKPGQIRHWHVRVDNSVLPVGPERSDGSPAEPAPMRVWPGPARVVISATLTHRESRWIKEEYQRGVPYETTESYWAMDFTNCRGAQASCMRRVLRTRTVRKYRKETRTRDARRSVDVVDDKCTRSVMPVFAQGTSYVLQYTYAGTGKCSITCLEQHAAPLVGGAVYTPCLAMLDDL